MRSERVRVTFGGREVYVMGSCVGAIVRRDGATCWTPDDTLWRYGIGYFESPSLQDAQQLVERVILDAFAFVNQLEEEKWSIKSRYRRGER